MGVRRLLKLFEKYGIKTTWFIPGHSLDTFPEECAIIRDAGHEMYDGYSLVSFDDVDERALMYGKRVAWLFS